MSGKDVYILATYTLNRGSRTVGPITWPNPPKSCLQSRALCGTVCALSIAIVFYKIDTLLACWFYIYYLVIFSSILIHDYTLCFTGSPCYNVSYYNYVSIWLYYIVIYLTSSEECEYELCVMVGPLWYYSNRCVVGWRSYRKLVWSGVVSIF